ncbi:MAG: helix-turn-helix transcriptional regulator [Ruminococcus sp.]
MRMDEIGYHHRHDTSFVIDRPNGAGDWLLLIMKTPAIFRIDGIDVHTKANSFLMYTPEYPEHYTPDGEEYIDDWMHFGPDEEEQQLIQQLKIPLNLAVHLGDISNVSTILRNMCYEYYSAHLHRVEIVNLYFRMLLYKLHEQMEIAHPSAVLSESVYGERLIWIRECIYRWPEREWNIDALAKELSLSRSRFQHLYAETFGSSVTQDLIQSRIQKACELLNQKKLSLEEIAQLCGYSSTSYFIRQFKQATGKTPSQFRSTYLQPSPDDIK